MQTVAYLARRFAPLRAMLLGCLLASPALLAEPALATPAAAPAWSVALTSYPTIFAHGSSGTAQSPPGYLLVATNVGGAATSGEFTIVDSLPPGLSLSIADGAYGSYGSGGHGMKCEASGQVVSCSGGKPALRPGETVRLNIPVEVAHGNFHSVRNEVTIGGGGAVSATVTTETPVGIGSPAFDFLPGEAGLYGTISRPDGSPATEAGSHPHQVSVGMNFPTSFGDEGLQAVEGGVRDLAVELPAGLVVNPQAVPTRCTESELQGGNCPEESQVGTVALALSLANGNPVAPVAPIYEMVPPPGTPVEFGFEATEDVYLHLLGRVRSDGDYGLSADIPALFAKLPILGAQVTLWGVPSDESHDYARGSCFKVGGACPLPVERTAAPFLTLPGSCGGRVTTSARADSWIEPGVGHLRSFENPPMVGCDQLAFEPSILLRPTSASADSPSGLDVALHVPQASDPAALATANLRSARIVLPEGLAVNPPVAIGLGSCSVSAAAATCPDASKLGTAEIETPLIDHPLSGAVYLAEPYENPFGSLLAIYIAIDDPVSGIGVKLAGRVEADPGDGRLTIHLDEAPELPIEDVRLEFFDGPRGLLRTPLACGTYTASTRLRPWSSPEGHDATPSDSFTIGAAAGACPASEDEAPNGPGFSAGSTSPQAGAYRPFVLRLVREDGSQRLGALETTLPPGLTGKLAGIPLCASPALDAGSCPAASRVGRVAVAAGAGAAPLRLGGEAYLAGPHHGAPLSLALLTPAVAGPFDLGTVVVRVALYVDRRSAQVRAVSAPFPTILKGIPLDLRSLAVELDRPAFTRNPTSCDPMAIGGVATSPAGEGAALSERFQVGGCSRLGFEPRVAVRLLGPTHRGAHPGLRAAVIPRRGDANLRRASITLPATVLLDSRQIRGVCGRSAYAAGRCPAASVYGHARVWTPLLDHPLEGPVFLRSGEGRLPDLVASLRGLVDLDLSGRLDASDGRLRATFQALPDIPVEKFVLNLVGGRKGLFANTGGVCRGVLRAPVLLAAQSGKSRDLSPRVRTRCEGSGKAR